MRYLAHWLANEVPEKEQCLPNKENGDTGVVLCANQAEVVFQIIEASIGDCTPIKIVHEVHGPQGWHDTPGENGISTWFQSNNTQNRNPSSSL